LNCLRASVFNFECLDILRHSIGHPCINLLSLEFAMSFHFKFGTTRYITGLNRTPSIKLLSFEIAQSFCSQFWACRYITRLNRTFEYKVIVVRNCSELLFSISSILIYYVTQSYIRVKSYFGMHFLRASVLNFERLDILPNSIGHPSKKLLSFEFYRSFRFQFGASQYIMGLCRTSE